MNKNESKRHDLQLIPKTKSNLVPSSQTFGTERSKTLETSNLKERKRSNDSRGSNFKSQNFTGKKVTPAKRQSDKGSNLGS